MDLAERVRRHIAKAVIGPSAARHLIPAGQIQSVRDFLRKLDTRQFTQRGKFSFRLDRSALAKKVPVSWGAARKFLNLYLREITYNFFVRQKNRLERIEHLLEVPLDSNVAKALRKKEARSAIAALARCYPSDTRHKCSVSAHRRSSGRGDGDVSSSPRFAVLAS